MSLEDKNKYLLIVNMDVAPERESLLNDIYDAEHVPALLSVPGVLSIRRYRRQPLKLALGTGIVTMHFEDEAVYSALYELESPEVLTSREWAHAVESGRWAGEVRPFTSNRRHTLHKLIRKG